MLDPLLFLLYINDFSKCSNLFDFHIFADDTNLFYSNSNLAELESVVNYNLKMVSDWLMANKVFFISLKPLILLTIAYY